MSPGVAYHLHFRLEEIFQMASHSAREGLGPLLSGRLSLAAGLLLVCGLAACDHGHHEAVQEVHWDSRSREMSEDRLADSARRSTNALETLTMIERAKAEPIASGISESLRDLPAELRRSTSVEWSGPAEALAKRLADSIGYSFMTLGDAPAVPLMVNVSVESIPV